MTDFGEGTLVEEATFIPPKIRKVLQVLFESRRETGATIAAIGELTASDLMSTKGFGRQMFRELVAVLAEHGVTLAPPLKRDWLNEDLWAVIREQGKTIAELRDAVGDAGKTKGG